jgi:hypothetical protein
MKFMDKNSRWNSCSSRSKFGKDIGSHIVVAIDVVDFQSAELVFKLSDFFNVCVHGILVDVPFLIDLLDNE